ncbi:MAG TPA: hypothetical protein V6C58_02540 [Allocoleopsis sp.]
MSLGKSLVTMGLTTAILAGNINPIQGQSNDQLVRLLENHCVSTTGNDWGKSNGDILIHRELDTVIAYLARGSGFSCRFSANDNSVYKNLILKFGLNDQGTNDDVKVNIYLNGNFVKSVKLKRGTVKKITFDVTKKHNVAIEAICINKGCDSLIYFESLHLEKKPKSKPKPKPKVKVKVKVKYPKIRK